MTLRRYLLIMGLTTVICWVSFVIVILQIDPLTGGPIGLTLFFVSLFYALWGTLSLTGFGARFLFKRHTVPFQYIGISLRQALWFAIMVTLSLFLVTQQLLVWWMIAVLILGLTILEGFFLARSLEARYHKRKRIERYNTDEEDD